MNTNRFYTILIVPEKTSKVKKIIVPSWLFRGSILGALFLCVLIFLMVYDYWYVMSEIHLNKELKTENLRLRQQVQLYKSKMNTIDNTLDRIKTFSTRLKMITNIEDHASYDNKNLQIKLPDASTNIELTKTTTDQSENQSQNLAEPEFDTWFLKVKQESIGLEQVLQDQYELLADKKAFLSALPTRKPSIGYFTSGFGVRRSPYGGSAKMHEGLDIANYIGTKIWSPADGIVLFSDTKPGYGQTLIIDH
ncbi:MAG: M23 family metallopeptidase, partial [Bdellovibrio sp.]|nr:M23 family metallopeptidase [Bdellovibrio sp.]